jgi:branched-chain amino acid transport system ATP-binding protein
MMLVCESINTYYGQAHVLFDVSFEVPEGNLVALIGRNGVGKSTTLKSIMGLAPARSGEIRFRGQSIERLEPFRIARIGVGYVPEDRRVFSELTIDENLQVAEVPGPWTRQRIYREFPALAELRERQAGLLSGGQQQMLTIARTLATNPKVLLMDEPTEGLAPVIVETLRSMVQGLKGDGQTCLLAAQDLNFALALADLVLIMDNGRITFRTTGEAARADVAALADRLAI